MPSFDYDFALQQCLGDHARARRVLTRFAERLPSDLEALRTAVSRGDAGAAADIAHRIKGAAATLAVHEIHRAALEAEQAGRAGILDAIPVCLEAMTSAAADFGRDVELRTSDSSS